jgi:DNA-binding NarL/FixJ family response regulator
MNEIRIILADTHRVFRQGCRELLDAEPGLSVVAEAADGLEAIDAVQRHLPEVLILELMLHSLDGMEVIRRVSRFNVETRSIVLSTYSDEVHVISALRNGASGYVPKEAGVEELKTAVRTVVRGEVFLSPAFAEYTFSDGHLSTLASLDLLERLTQRHREILKLIAEGRTTNEIAQALFISAKTVETHRANLMLRLEIRDVPGLVRFAIRSGLVNLDHDG